MRMRPSLITLAIALISCAAAPAVAQRYPFRTISENDGLPMSNVEGLVQEPDGRLWVSGRSGLAAFDGLHWEHVEQLAGRDVPSLGGIGRDGAGRLWTVGRATPVALFRRDDDGWTRLPDDPNSSWGHDVAAMAVDPDGGPQGTVATTGGGLHLWHDGAWQRVPLPGQPAIRHLAWHDGVLLAATTDGLMTVTPDSAGPARVAAVPGLPPGPAYATVPDQRGSGLLVVGHGWIGHLEAGRFTTLLTDERIDLPHATSGVAAALDSLGSIWCGDRLRLLVYHPLSGLDVLEQDSGLIARGVTALTVDRDGQVWAGGMRGISALADQRFTNWDKESGLFADEVTSVHQLPDGRMLLGHEGGLTIMGTPPRTLRIGREDQWGRVMAIESAPDGTQWLACGALGLAHLDRALNLQWPLGPREPGRSISAVAVGSDGTVWAGGSDGLQRLGEGGFVPVPLATAEDPHDPSVRRIVNGPDGSLWLTTGRRGVLQVKGAYVRRYWAADDPEANSTYAVFPAPGGGWWVGTAAGLRRLTDEGIEARRPGDPPVERAIFAIVADDRGRVWFGTDAGVRVWDGTDLRSYGVRDGLIGSETNRDAVTVDRRGRVWIGTDRGLTVFDERFGWHGARPPAARIEGYEVDGERRPADAPLALGPDTRELVVRLGVDSVADALQLGFRTFLDGYDARWHAARVLPDRTLRFTSLPPGHYRFAVQAVDAGGRVGPVATGAAITVAPPLWQRPWVLVLAVVVGVGLVWLVFSVAAGRRYTRRLRHEVLARTAELEASEQAIRRESRRLAVVLGSISDGVVVVGADGRISLGNAAAARLVDVPAERLAGRSLEEVLPGLTALVREVRAASLTGTSNFVPADAPLPYRIGASGRDLEIAVAPLETAGGPDGARVLAFRDVTGRRRSDRAKVHSRRLESLGVLAGGIAHDFNNLLTVMLGNTTVARELPGLPPEVGTRLDNIEEAAGRACELTRRLLIFARSEPPQRRPTDPAELVRRAAALAPGGAAHELTVTLAPDLHPVNAEADDLVEALTHLLENAWHAMPAGGRTVLDGRNVDDPAGEPCVELTVRDEGPGIPSADLDRIFEPYYVKRTGGDGLGLAIAYIAVARHGGRLTAATGPGGGGGAIFTVQLPAVRPVAAGVRRPDSAPSA